MFFPILFFLLLGCFITWLVIHSLYVSDLGKGSAGDPQHHHTHTGVVPRIGGVGLVMGLSATYLLCFFLLDARDHQSLMHYALFAGGVAAFLLGFIDDFHPLGAKCKLLGQIAIATAATLCGLEIGNVVLPIVNTPFDLGLFGVPLTVLWFVAMMNLINLIDGLDGLAGGIALMLMVLLAYLGFEGGIAFSAILALGMTGAILGFLFHNFPPAKVYMGDSGAYMLGFLIAGISLINSHKGTVVAALIAPVLALALPITDVAFAMLRRGLKGLPIFRPDRHHIHHKLMRAGLSRRNTVLVLYSLSLAALAAALLVFTAQGRYLAIFLGFGFVIVLFVLRGKKIITIDGVRDLLTESVRSRDDARNAVYLRDWLIVEAERADTGKNLWSDFRFVLKKMGFCRAELEVGADRRSFFVPHTPHEDADALWQETHVMNGADNPVRLTVYAEKENFSERQFALLSDVAAEAWGKAMQRWKRVNNSGFSFQAKAVEVTDYRRQKARGIYRPTY